jgi:hypothetical protein
MGQDRLGRIKSEAPMMIPVAVPDTFTPSAIISAVTYEWFTGRSKKSNWMKEVTARSEVLLGTRIVCLAKTSQY